MKKTELLKQIKALQDEVNELKVRVTSLEVNKSDRNCFPQYSNPCYPVSHDHYMPGTEPTALNAQYKT